MCVNASNCAIHSVNFTCVLQRKRKKMKRRKALCSRVGTQTKTKYSLRSFSWVLTPHTGVFSLPKGESRKALAHEISTSPILFWYLSFTSLHTFTHIHTHRAIINISVAAQPSHIVDHNSENRRRMNWPHPSKTMSKTMSHSRDFVKEDRLTSAREDLPEVSTRITPSVETIRKSQRVLIETPWGSGQ